MTFDLETALLINFWSSQTIEFSEPGSRFLQMMSVSTYVPPKVNNPEYVTDILKRELFEQASTFPQRFHAQVLDEIQK